MSLPRRPHPLPEAEQLSVRASTAERRCGSAAHTEIEIWPVVQPNGKSDARQPAECLTAPRDTAGRTCASDSGLYSRACTG